MIAEFNVLHISTIEFELGMEKIIIEMLEQRGYTNIYVRENETGELFDIECVDNDNKTVYVKYLTVRIKIPHFFKKYMEDIDNPTDIHHIIILRKKHSNSFSKLCLPYDVEIFTRNELQVNITKHILVPNHTRIPFTERDEIKKLLQLYSCDTIDNFPVLQKNDPVCRFYGGKIGDIFKIKRISPITGEYVSYRHVA